MSDALQPKRGIPLSDDQKLDWLRLFRSENVGPTTFVKLINRYGTAKAALEALPELAAKGSGRKITICSVAQAESEWKKLTHHGAKLVCIGEPHYPPALRAADGAPPLLTVLGDLDALTRNTVAVVGSRNASLAGNKLTHMLASQVGQAGYCIASGLARGIDAAAHNASLNSGTVAVFAGGIDYIYPKENRELASAIAQNHGALITEMPFGWTPRAQDFPRRNRIVAGMALGLLVVEAARRSGSLISARLANEMGRLVFAVPGSPLDPRSEGANHLIREGAQLVTKAGDILEALDPLTKSNLQANYELSETDGFDLDADPSETERERLISAIGHTPTDVDELMRFTGIEPGVVQLIILELALAGRLEHHTGNRVSMV